VNSDRNFGYLGRLSDLFSVICALLETALFANSFTINHITHFHDTKYSSTPQTYLIELKEFNHDFKRILVTAKHTTQESMAGNTACP
jgi:hypothetical protein